MTSPAKGRCPSAHAGAEGLAAGRDAFTIERGHPTLPLHRPCGRSPSPWQGRFCPGPSFRPAPHPPAMQPRRGGHWPSAVPTSKHNTPMRISTRLGFTNLHRRVAFWGMIPRTSDAAQSGGLCCILSPSCGGSAAGNGIHSHAPTRSDYSRYPAPIWMRYDGYTPIFSHNHSCRGSHGRKTTFARLVARSVC